MLAHFVLLIQSDFSLYSFWQALKLGDDPVQIIGDLACLRIFVGAPLLDMILAFLLLLVLPIRAIRRSRTTSSDTPRRRKYTATILMVTSLVTILGIDWWMAGRSANALGLGFPTTTPALIGMGVSAGLLALFRILIWYKRGVPAPEAERAARELLPQTAGETRMFVVFSLAVGLGWEVLYRGFLLFYLPLYVGLVAAVVVSAIAYGVGHGFKNFGQFAGSIVAALAFAIGYALTANLWWLVLLHVGLPLLTLTIRPDERNGVVSDSAAPLASR